MRDLLTLLRNAVLDDATWGSKLEARIQRDGSSGFRWLERVLRSREAYTRSGLRLTEFAALLPEDISRLSTSLLVCLSMQRDGFVRQRATSLLASRPEAIGLAAVLNRITDPVWQIASQAFDTCNSLLQDIDVDHIIWCLPLLDRLLETPRGANSPVHANFSARLTRTPDAAIAALDAAARGADQHMRLSAFSNLARIFPAELPQRLPIALDDRNPALRRWAGHAALHAIAKDQLEKLLPLIASNRSPSLRLLALKEYRRQGDTACVQNACLDSNANVRFYARRYLRKLQGAFDHRETALAILQNRGSQTSRIVGALALLSELGRERDREVIAGFAVDKRKSVAAEAVRTLRLLGCP